MLILKLYQNISDYVFDISFNISKCVRFAENDYIIVTYLSFFFAFIIY